jgi:GST-like protein
MIVTPTNKSVTVLEGLHLFHADISNCSMRVRMVLAEKELPWTSHHLDLRKKETVTPEYFGVHPKGLVPTLVHNGVVHIESNEIIEYLDETYSDPPLQPQSGKERDVMHEWLRTATEIHVPAVKTLIYTRKIGKVLHKNEAEDAKYRSLQRDPQIARVSQPRLDRHRIAEGASRPGGGHAAASIRHGRRGIVAARVAGRRSILAC